MTTAIQTLSAEIDTLRSEPIPAVEAWRAVCSLVRGRGASFTKQIAGWGRDHYADCNASGGNSETRCRCCDRIIGQHSPRSALPAMLDTLAKQYVEQKVESVMKKQVGEFLRGR